MEITNYGNFLHAVSSSLGHSILLISKYSVQRSILNVVSLYSALRAGEKEAHYIRTVELCFTHFNMFHVCTLIRCIKLFKGTKKCTWIIRCNFIT